MRKSGLIMRKSIPFSLIALLVSEYAYGALGGPHSLVDLVGTADLIVVGSASGGAQAGSVLGFAVHVARVVKGDPAMSGANVPVAWAVSNSSAAAMASSPFTASGNGLWFLQRGASGWRLLPVVDGEEPFNSTFFPQPSGPISIADAYGPTAPLADVVASEVSYAIESADDGGARLLAVYSSLLDQLNSPVVQKLYTRLSASNNTSQKILGMSGLIRGGSTPALTAAAQLGASLGNYPLENGVLSNAIRDDFRGIDANSVQVLGQIATGSTGAGTLLREAAAFALRSIHTKEALPYLAAFMDDADQGIRAEGIGGLSAFANGLPVQTPANVVSMAYLKYPASAPFQTDQTKANFAMGLESIAPNETVYLSFWKTWWAQNRAALGY
jgi:hypothetical protein